MRLLEIARPVSGLRDAPTPVGARHHAIQITIRAFGSSTIAVVGGCALGQLMLLVIAVTPGVIAQAVATEPREQLHFTVNMHGDYAGAASAGFNLADVSTLSALRALPEGMKGVYWLGNGYNLELFVAAK